jgi:hypothetical protein
MVNLLSRFSSHASELCGSFWRKVIMILSHIYRGIERCNVGKGDTVLFWKDLWEDQVMTDQCPHLHSFSINDDISVSDFCDVADLSISLCLKKQIKNGNQNGL